MKTSPKDKEIKEEMIKKLELARKEYFRDESFYAYKKNARELCEKFGIDSIFTLLAYIQKVDIPHHQSDAQSLDTRNFGAEENLEFYHGFNDN